MAETGRLSECFETLQEETLPGLGVDNPTWTRILAARLLIERVGERNANYWWDSQVLSSFGSDTLNETVPRTSTRAQISLATKVGRKAESDAIGSENVVSLFDLGPFVESRIQREVESLEGNGDLSVLESQSVEITETGWTNTFSDGDTEIATDTKTSYELGSIDIDDLQNESVRQDVVSQLIAGYGASTKQNLVVPYYSTNP